MVKKKKQLYIIICTVILVICLCIKSNDFTNQTIEVTNKKMKEVPKKEKNVPMFNYNTQKVEQYKTLGVMYNKDSSIILPLYGRRTNVRSSVWNYKTETVKNKLKVEIEIDGRNCVDSQGCTELYDNDSIYIHELNDNFKIKKYK